MPRHLLVANPTAQSGKNAERIDAARVLLDAAGVSHGFVATAAAGGTVDVVKRAIAADPAIDTAIYMGGDGTFAEVAKGILGCDRPSGVRLAMLPTGTANDQGKSFGLTSDEAALAHNIEVLAAGHETRLDVGRLRGLDYNHNQLHEVLFFDSAGWGISPRVLQLRNEDRKAIADVPVLRDIYRDQLVYAGALLRTFLNSYLEDDKFDVEVVCDGEKVTWPNLSDLVVKGTRIYGGLWVFDPDARHDDGLFEVVPFAGKRDWVSKALVHLDGSGLAAESLDSVGVRHSANVRGAHVELCFDEHPGGLPIVAQVDGEEHPATPRAIIDVLPRALRLVVPLEFAGESAAKPAT